MAATSNSRLVSALIFCCTKLHLSQIRIELAGFERQQWGEGMIKKLASGAYRLYSRKKNPKTGRRRNLGTFKSKEAARAHERAVQYFKRH